MSVLLLLNFTRYEQQDQIRQQLFVFNNNYAVSGAQPVKTFAAALDKTWTDK